MQNGQYGTLSVDADGEWQYALNNSSSLVQQLAQGEHATDMFTVNTSDGLGGSGTQTVSVDVVGTDDAPFITSASPSPFNGGYVVEDGVHQVASGVAIAIRRRPRRLPALVGDPQYQPRRPHALLGELPGPARRPHRHEERRSGSSATTSTTASRPPRRAARQRVQLPGERHVQRERAAAPSSNGQLAAAQRGVGIDDLMAGHLLTVGSNIDPADLTRGLKIDDDFVVSARFDLLVAARPARATAFR